MKTNNKKVEDKFYGKRVVKGIFAKVNISSQINAAKQLGVQMARENKSSEYGDSRWNTLLNETYKMVGGENTDQGSNVSKQLREAWKSANEKEQGRIKKIQQDASFKLEAVVRSLKSKLESKGFCSNNKNCSPQDKALQQEIGEAFSYETSDQQFISLIRKMTARLGQPFGVASKNRRRGVKAIFAATKEQTINEIRGLKIIIQTYENQLKTHKNLLKSALKYLKTLGEGEETFFRTGSKARFANEEIARGLSKVLKANGFNAMASEVLSGSTDSETLRKYIRALKSKMSPMSGNDRGMVLLQTLEKQLASRTGSKAKFAVPFKPGGLNPVTSKYQNAMYKIQSLSKALESYMQKKYAEANVFLKRIIENDGVTPEEKTRMDELIYEVQPFTKSKLISSRTGVKAFK